jgi:hypothetical protein
MSTINNIDDQDLNLASSYSSKTNLVNGTASDNRGIQSMQSKDNYKFAHFAESKEMEEGIERILGDNSIQ